MTARILVVDDDPHVREVLRRMLTRDGYSVSTASDGVAALDAIASQPPDLVILDITMPRMDGFSVCRTIKANPATALIPVTMLTGRHSEEERRAGIEAGTDDFLAKPFDSATLRARVRSQIRSKQLIDQLEDSNQILAVLAQTVEEKDTYTSGHVQRLERYSASLAVAIGLSVQEARAARYGGILHDIGKICISEEILRKPGPLTDGETAEMRKHPEIGARIVQPLRLGSVVAPIVRHHHERWDGGGYPDGLAGRAIPLGARIVAVVDAYDAMTTDRPYRRRLPREVALERLRAAAGSQLDPALVEVFVTLDLSAPSRND